MLASRGSQSSAVQLACAFSATNGVALTAHMLLHEHYRDAYCNIATPELLVTTYVDCHVMLQGTLRVLLVLLHDFPEFLCEYHFQLCNVIPPSCIQMRNLILSAFPRNMRLPDPFTPNLKVDLLPEINQSPKFVPEPQNLLPAELRYASASPA